MDAMFDSARPWSLDSMSPDARQRLLHCAAQLERAAAAGAALPQPLRGKRLALLTDDHASAAARAFMQAATELGAHVSPVRASGSEAAPGRMAALLGRLYDAIECQGLPAADVRRLGREAGVPVFDGIGQASHPLYRLGEPQQRQPLRLLQALLSVMLA